jgi:hypothetical protein
MLTNICVNIFYIQLFGGADNNPFNEKIIAEQVSLHHLNQ